MSFGIIVKVIMDGKRLEMKLGTHINREANKPTNRRILTEKIKLDIINVF
jgi:hypothetical protein